MRILDVRHDEPARRGRGDAEVHVVLDDDLLVGPLRVHRRVAPHGPDHRLRHDEQRGDLHPGEVGGCLQPLGELHRPGRVDVDEQAHVRRAERAGHHRVRDRLAHARAPGCAPRARSATPGVWMLRNTLACDACRMTSSRVISPTSPVGVTVRQVDGEVLRELADRRLRDDRMTRMRPAPSWAGPAVAAPSAGCARAGAAAAGGDLALHAVADQNGRRLLLFRDARSACR